MKSLLLVLPLILLTACDPRTYDVSNEFNVPTELKDCQLYEMTDDVMNRIYIMRCPNSTTATSYMQGKARRSAIYVG